MIDAIPTSEAALETWLVDSSGNVAVSGAGLALLEAQITSLTGRPTKSSVRLTSPARKADDPRAPVFDAETKPHFQARWQSFDPEAG